MQMALTCEASQMSLNAPSTFVRAASTNVNATGLAKRTCTPDENTAALAWQAKSTRNERVNGGAY